MFRPGGGGGGSPLDPPPPRSSKSLPPPTPVQQTINSSKNAVRTGVFVGHAVRYPINSVPKPSPSLIRSQKITLPNEVIEVTKMGMHKKKLNAKKDELQGLTVWI